MRKHLLTSGLAALSLAAFAVMARADAGKEKEYKSPYSVKFTYPLKELIGDIEHGERGDAKRESSVPHAEWYSAKIRREFGAWGPPTRHYPAPAGLHEKPLKWKQQRTIALALRYVGYGYQHHHVPDWDPPRDWPWKETAVGHNGKGVDCSNFSAIVMNQGFGLKPTGAVKAQSALKEFPAGEGKMHKVQHIKLPANYAELVKTLRTGDLLYIRNNREEISHVVLWVGSIGEAPENMPLIIDSHGEGVKDSRGVSIPCGIHLRPFREHSWYHKSADHAIRVWQE